jgi:hypothetical protein
MLMGVDSILIMNLLITRENINDSKVPHGIADSVVNFLFILADFALETKDAYDYAFENTHSSPVTTPTGEEALYLRDYRWTTELGNT